MLNTVTKAHWITTYDKNVMGLYNFHLGHWYIWITWDYKQLLYWKNVIYNLYLQLFTTQKQTKYKANQVTEQRAIATCIDCFRQMLFQAIILNSVNKSIKVFLWVTHSNRLGIRMGVEFDACTRSVLISLTPAVADIISLVYDTCKQSGKLFLILYFQLLHSLY